MRTGPHHVCVAWLPLLRSLSDRQSTVKYWQLTLLLQPYILVAANALAAFAKAKQRQPLACWQNNTSRTASARRAAAPPLLNAPATAKRWQNFFGWRTAWLFALKPAFSRYASPARNAAKTC
ncbi:hypothetical protein NPIL_7451 [Nephila pilipes]|uniref:Uncharacterized protein n=1 Tax=Nephila pilipes TaxID=299642 RepID=A0A8X6PBN3_NEPPI|nr:hypothetical protein NPIL_7451 [Nephila pilipes]